MNNTLIVTDSVRDINHLVREWNAAGNNLVNYKVIAITDLEREIALYALAQQGQELKREVGANAAAFLVQNILLKGIETGSVMYFRTGSLDFATCQEIVSKLDILRSSELFDSFLKSDDPKIRDLKWLTDEYEAMLTDNQWMDQASFLDVSVSDGWAQKWYEENPREVRTLLFGNITAKEKKLLALLGAAKENRFDSFLSQNHTLRFLKAYGAVNEIRHIVDEIREKSLRFGDISVCYTSDVYEEYIKSVFGAAGIPYAFVTGRAGKDEDYIALAVTILQWAENGYRYEDLLPVFTSPVIRNSGGIRTYNNELRSGIGMTLERYQNYIRRSEAELAEPGNSDPDSGEGAGNHNIENRKDFLETLDGLVSIFSADRSCYGYLNAIIHWLGDHTSVKAVNRKKDLDALRSLLPDALLIPANGEEAVSALLEMINGLKVKDAESPAAVSVIRLGEPGVSERSYNFFVGLSAKELEYSTADSPVLSDEELMEYTGGTAPDLARDAAKRRTEALAAWISSSKGEVTLSYSSYDLVNLLRQTESSFYHDLLVRTGGREITAGFAGISQGAIHICSDILDHGSLKTGDTADSITTDGMEGGPSGSAASPEGRSPQEIIRDRLKRYTFSASSLMTYDDCPRRFYYHHILRLPDIQKAEYKPDQWLSGADRGNLFHGVLREYVQKCFLEEKKDSFEPDIFNEIFRKQIDLALQKTMYVSENAFHMECEDYRNELTVYLKRLHTSFNHPAEGSDWKVEAVEYPVYEADGKTGIVIDRDFPDVRFGGRIDRIDSWTGADGKRHYRIVDYKTSSRSRLTEEVDEGENGTKKKIPARRQHDVYMALYPSAEEFEYDLLIDDPDNTEPIHKYRNEENIHQIAEKLESQLYNNETDITFPPSGKADGKGCCIYCNYQSVCRMYNRKE